ncbi:MAG: rubredoxin [Planctomycetota bacterium]
MEKFICTVCGYIYFPERGDPPAAPPGTPFSELPGEWVCPTCGWGREKFARFDPRTRKPVP